MIVNMTRLTGGAPGSLAMADELTRIHLRVEREQAGLQWLNNNC